MNPRSSERKCVLPEDKSSDPQTRIEAARATVVKLERVESELRSLPEKVDRLRKAELMYRNAEVLNEARMRLAFAVARRDGRL